MIRHPIANVLLVALVGQACGATHFIEAERFKPSSDGWRVVQKRSASKLHALHGAVGDPAGTAVTHVTLAEAGMYRVWVRHNYGTGRRGAFGLDVLRDGRKVAGKAFDLEEREKTKNWAFVWDSLEAELPAGAVELRLSKVDQKNCSGYVRFVDCVALTTDLDQVPNHLDYGTPTYVRVTIGAGYEKPVYIHVFADHYRAPWYSHHHLAAAGAGDGLRPPKGLLLASGDRTPWCDLSRMIYQDSGAILNLTARHTYHDRPDHLTARLEFATTPDEQAVVRTLDVDARPNGLVVVMPPDLTTEENLARFGRDKDFAERTGRLADAHDWPALGKQPDAFPFFVSASLGGYGTPVDESVTDRELKTIGHFGFANWTKTRLGGGMWHRLEHSYCRPDLERIKAVAAQRAAGLAEAGKTAKDVTYCMLMDEPGGQSLEFMAGDPAYHEAMRAWLKNHGLTPSELLVPDWGTVKPVTREQREDAPALYYFSQRFRTRALGDFMAVQRRELEAACGGAVPVLVNFSDGATYYANFYGQGVDYFELLDDDGQNAIWGEDWANGASSYQCAAYNVDLMRAAARPLGQTVGHYLVAHAGRKPLDVKLKAAGEVARGVKIFKSFSYGVYWGSHEGGPAWRSSVWQAKPEMWGPHAELMREIGGAEDLLVPAMPAPARVAILYSSSSDIWQVGDNNAYGFDRMHTWMALAHAQVPVDFVPERQVAAGALDGYDVCYLSGPNLTRAAAAKVVDWVCARGVLSITAGAGSRDEYNRPLAALDTLLPATRGEVATPQAFLSSGRYVYTLRPADVVTVGEVALDVLSVKQGLMTVHGDATVLGTYQDGAPAWVRGTAGKGTVYCAGFLPGLDYIRQAVVARRALAERVTQEEQVGIDGPDAAEEAPVEGVVLSQADRARLECSANPWAYPGAVRDAILAPVRAAGVEPPVTCSVPLVDAVYMTCDKGLVIPLANYTLQPLESVDFTVRVDRPVVRMETIHQGRLDARQEGGRISFSIPLASTDYVKIYYR